MIFLFTWDWHDHPRGTRGSKLNLFQKFSFDRMIVASQGELCTLMLATFHFMKAGLQWDESKKKRKEASFGKGDCRQKMSWAVSEGCSFDSFAFSFTSSFFSLSHFYSHSILLHRLLRISSVFSLSLSPSTSRSFASFNCSCNWSTRDSPYQTFLMKVWNFIQYHISLVSDEVVTLTGWKDTPKHIVSPEVAWLLSSKKEPHTCHDISTEAGQPEII